MKKLLGMILLGILLLPQGAGAEDYFQTVNTAEVARLMGRPGIVIFDVNVPEIWAKYHIPGAVHIDSPAIGQFLPADKKATLIFYCAGPLCQASGLAANEAVLFGYRRVYVMPEGIAGWVRGGYPTQAGGPGGKKVVRR
jgi:rhodanese-related sulfurtransferase